MALRFLLTLAAAGWAAISSAQAQQVRPACSENMRACAIRTATLYLDGLVAHSSAKVPFAADVRCTEQGRLYVEGEVKYRAELDTSPPIIGRRNTRFYYDDKENQLFVWLLIDMMLPDPKDETKKIQWTIHKTERFKIVGGFIKEVEILNVQKPGAVFDAAPWPDQH